MIAMNFQWEEIHVDLIPYAEDESTCVVGGESVEEASLILEDQLIQT
jgi:hypothetical protein